MVKLILLIASFVTTVFGDECQNFCISKLGLPACGKGSFCKGANTVCHGLFWRENGVDICFHDGLDPTCSSRTLRAVKCAEAASSTSSVPTHTTTTTTPTTTTTTAARIVPDVVLPAARRTRDRIVSSRGTVYSLEAQLGRGSVGEVLRATAGGMQVAIKIVPKGEPATEREKRAYRDTARLPDFPRLIEQFEDSNSVFLVLSLMGPSVQDLRKIGGGKHRPLSLESVGSIGMQIIDRLEALHGLNYVHLDLYPNNIAVGSGADQNKLFLIDYGETRPVTLETMNVFSRRNDIRCLSHTILQLLVPDTVFGDYKHFEEARPRVTVEDLCRGLPSPVLRLFRYSHEEMSPSDVPDYDRLRSFMMELAPRYRGSIVIA
jgi:hypothetical protein